ncbi:MAG: peptidase m14 carboxypeptidase a [Bacteroidetes bacterium]|nr:MAG: peptidase m14 carboxypeptidase a [Bacteroidota bacterium]
MKRVIALFSVILVLNYFHKAVFCQENALSAVTGYEALQQKIQSLDSESDLLTTEIIGQSVEGRNLVAMKFSAGVFGTDDSKTKVLIFAQQHGNEQSGKEGALLLASWLLRTENQSILQNMDVAVVPQVNPDGSEANRRRNANNADLNRNHLILTEPETQALHHFFKQYLFEVTLDVHEYSPYSEEWKKYGYRKNTDVALGSCTNPSISAELRELSNTQALPYIMKHLEDMGFKSFVYCPGGPPELDYIRHSTFDINDGRQSFGIQQSFSFIQEGMNGTDMFAENIAFRARGQMEGMAALLNFVHSNAAEIKETVHRERLALFNADKTRKVSIQAIHVSDGRILRLPLFSYRSGRDTVVEVKDYRPVVRSITDAALPLGYLIPITNNELNVWANRQGLVKSALPSDKSLRYDHYFIHAIDSIDFEGDVTVDPVAELMPFKELFVPGDYVFYPASQIKGNMMAIALEPKSILGLVTYPLYSNLLVAGSFFPVIRVTEKD